MKNQNLKTLSFYPVVVKTIRTKNMSRRAFRKQTNCVLSFYARLKAAAKRFRKA